MSKASSQCLPHQAAGRGSLPPGSLDQHQVRCWAGFHSQLGEGEVTRNGGLTAAELMSPSFTPSRTGVPDTGAGMECLNQGGAAPTSDCVLRTAGMGCCCSCCPLTGSLSPCPSLPPVCIVEQERKKDDTTACQAALAACWAALCCCCLMENLE